jgi:hypothetical protein
MTALIVFLGVVAFIVTFLLFLAHLQEKHMSALEQLARALEKGRAAAPRGFFSTLEQCAVTGRLEGHDVSFRFTTSDKTRFAIVAVAVQNPAASFDVREAHTLERLGRWLGLASDAHGDAGLVVRDRTGEARGLIQATGVRAALQSVLALPGVSAVTLEGSTLWIRQRHPEFTSEALLHVVRTLVQLARRCGRVPVKVTAREAKPRFAWTDGGADARCPYCRDAIDPAGEAALACGRCQTVHHRACLDEAGGCTVFGCGERAGARERS